MRRSSYRRAATRRGPDRRLIAAVAVLVAFGGVIGITQISDAGENKVAACAPAAGTAAPTGSKAATDPKVGTYTDKDGDVQHKGDGQLAKGERANAPEPAAECKDGNTVKKTVNGLEITTDTCEDSRLTPHDGFQNGNRCVSTEFGEVGEAAKNPTLLITEFPRQVEVGEPFTLKVSTRNLVRDRFLAAGQGGYYVESSVLTDQGLVRGHFHTACRMLQSTDEAVDPAPVPAFFVATEDKKGGAEPDTVTIQVPGMPQAGVAQCASWAGDGSHRVPMMQRANQTPAIDAVRVLVDGGDNGGDQGDGDNGGGQDQPTTPPADNGGDNGGDNGDQGDNGGDQGDGGNGGATTPPKTETGTTPPKAPTVTIPPKKDDEPTKAPKPVKTTTAPADSDSDTTPARNESGKTTAPKPSESTQAATAAGDDDEDTGAPDEPEATDTTEVRDVEAAGDNRLALTGANVTTVGLGGAVLILAGLLALSATRKRRAEMRED
ncbi:hypothetical protein AB0368_01840 [Actinoplanes sp. NPDC051475]|uniref:hypothetical protein n=1 Tax=Actinoplanes sp. NPDC051475 TaxID=3157225 RepID=UPI00344B31C6